MKSIDPKAMTQHCYTWLGRPVIGLYEKPTEFWLEVIHREEARRDVCPVDNF